MIDAVARELKIDRAEIRFRNFIQPDQFPYDTPSGQTYDSGDYPEMLRRALGAIDYEKLKREQAEGRERGRLLGIGIATAVEPGGSNLSYGMLVSGPSQLLSGQGEAARVRLETDGSATVFTGGLDSGQGHATALAQIVADELALDVKQIRVATTFDSASHPYVMTSGVYSNKFHGHDTVAAIGAARKVRDKLLRRAAAQLEANVDDLELRDGHIAVRGAPDRGVSVAQIASRAYWSLADEQPDGEPGLEALYYYSNPLAKHPDEKKRVRVQLGFASAAHVAVVDIDPETFEIKVLRYLVIHDCGRQINPAIVEGPSPWRRRPRYRRGASGGVYLRRKRSAPHHQFHGLPKAHSRRLTEYRRRSAGNSFAADVARNERGRRRRRRGRAGGDRQRGRRRAGAVGNSHRGAADRAEPVVGSCRKWIKTLRERTEMKN